MKRFICIVSIVCILFSIIPVTSFAWLTRADRYPESKPAFGGSASKFVDKGLPAPIVADPAPSAVPGRINIKFDGEFEYFYEKPILTDGRVFLPFRELFEFFDLSVSWDDESNTAIAKNEETEIKITTGSTTTYVNGNLKTLDVPAFITGGRTYVPLRFVAESLGYSVGWDGRNGIVNIYTSGGGAR